MRTNMSTQLPPPNLLNSHTYSLLLPAPPPLANRAPSDLSLLLYQRKILWKHTCMESVPKKAREDTKYCVNLLEE